MSADILVTAGLPAAVAIIVPWFAFRYALRQEHSRWLREQRAALYADFLVEALAEQEWCQHAMASEDTQASANFEDLRLPRLERARLGARGSSLGSKEVNLLFNKVGTVIGRIHLAYSLGQVDRDLAQMQLRMQAGKAFDLLEAAIREEMDADHPLARPRLRRTVTGR